MACVMSEDDLARPLAVVAQFPPSRRLAVAAAAAGAHALTVAPPIKPAGEAEHHRRALAAKYRRMQDPADSVREAFQDGARDRRDGRWDCTWRQDSPEYAAYCAGRRMGAAS